MALLSQRGRTPFLQNGRSNGWWRMVKQSRVLCFLSSLLFIEIFKLTAFLFLSARIRTAGLFLWLTWSIDAERILEEDSGDDLLLIWEKKREKNAKNSRFSKSLFKKCTKSNWRFFRKERLIEYKFCFLLWDFFSRLASRKTWNWGSA